MFAATPAPPPGLDLCIEMLALDSSDLPPGARIVLRATDGRMLARLSPLRRVPAFPNVTCYAGHPTRMPAQKNDGPEHDPSTIAFATGVAIFIPEHAHFVVNVQPTHSDTEHPLAHLTLTIDTFHFRNGVLLMQDPANKRSVMVFAHRVPPTEVAFRRLVYTDACWRKLCAACTVSRVFEPRYPHTCLCTCEHDKNVSQRVGTQALRPDDT